jgi:DNA-directed RNA polymerase specialized sigma subunit
LSQRAAVKRQRKLLKSGTTAPEKRTRTAGEYRGFRWNRGKEGNRTELKETYDRLLLPRRLADDIHRLDLRREELITKLLPKAITYDTDRVQTTPEDRVAVVMAEVDELDRKIEELKRQRFEAIQEIAREIDLLEDSRERAILDAYYLSGKSMESIAEHAHYSLSHTYALRRHGIQNIIKIINGSAI